MKKISEGSHASHLDSRRRRKLSTETVKLLSQIQGRIETIDTATKIWQDYLSDRERSTLGGHLEDAWRQYRGTLGMVSHARKCNPSEALLWLCEEIGTLPAAQSDRCAWS